jgi:hydroxyethylthiazole kinase-like sugar kinase family protein
MFRKTIDAYAKDFLGREHYERIASLFKKMIAIKGGSDVVSDMVNQYKVIYKGRKAMMEVIGRIK